MVYPGKTSPDAIRKAAIDVLEREGGAALTMRRVASELGLTPNALYRYYSGRDVLVAAVADEAARRLLATINDTLDQREADDEAAAPTAPERIRMLTEVYAEFARANPALYTTLMTDMTEAEAALAQPLGHDALWDRVLEIIAPLTGSENAPAAAVTLWSLMHGMWALERANLLRGRKPNDVGRFGINAFIKGLTSEEP